MRTDGHICLSSPSLAQPLPGGPRPLLVDRVPGSTVHARARPLATGSAGVIRRPTPTEPTVTRGTRLDDGEQRLAALWEHELDDAAADAKTADDVIAALFSSSPDGEAQTNQRASTSRTRRSTSRASGQRRHARARPRRAHLPHRLLGAGAAVAAAFALLFVAPDWFGEHPDNVATKARPQAGHAATAVARGRAAQPERTVRDSRTVRRHHRRPATKQAPEVARPRRKPSRAAHRERDPPTPPPSRSPSARPLAEPAPPHARRGPVSRPDVVGLRRVSPLLMALHVDARGGLMLLTAAPYDDEIVTHIRSLPERRYRRQTRDWCIPARRAHLRAVCALIGELEERSIDVNVSADASARLARLDVGRAVPPRRRHRGRGRLQPAPSAGVARLAGAPIRRGPQDLDGPADAGRRAGDPRSGRPHRPARDHAASPSRTATISRAQSTDDTRQARLRRRAHESEAAVAGRALEALHGRSGLRQPRPRARCCAGHRVVRSHPGQSASGRAVTRARHGRRVRERPVRRRAKLLFGGTTTLWAGCAAPPTFRPSGGLPSI